MDVWDALDFYIENLLNDSDCTIIEQVSWILQKTIESGQIISEELNAKIFSIEGKLHKLFRFLSNNKLLKLETLCKHFLKIIKCDIVIY